MRVAVDAMGGDHAPRAVVAGAVEAARAGVGSVLLVGPSALLREELERSHAFGLPIEVIEAPDVIGPEEQPVVAVRRKKNSSIAVGLGLVREGRADAFVSAGNTGALMAASLFILGRIPGVRRPAIGGIMPTVDGRGCLMLDMGAHMDASPLNLYQYAFMGSVYAEKVLGVANPRIGLLNVGTEENKGNELTKEAFRILRQSPLNFVGNVEGRDIFDRRADVIVCDGFTGNVILKTLEGVGQGMAALLRRELTSGLRVKLGALLARPALQRFARSVDYREYGGAPILGVDGPCIKCHGSSDAKAVANGIKVAVRVASQGVTGVIRQQLALGAEALQRAGFQDDEGFKVAEEGD